MTATPDLDERFHTGAQKYASYLETPAGRLRTELAFANLLEFLPAMRSSPTPVLDVGCGTGAIGVRLAQLGYQVTLLDSSRAMLDIAKRTAERAGVSDRITIRRGDAMELEKNITSSFDVIVCHNVLEFLDDAAAVLRACAHALRHRSAILSIVVRNQAGEVLKTALSAENLESAAASLNAEWGHESLYGEKVRLFTHDGLVAMLEAESLEPAAERGIRVVADYLPSSISRAEDYADILELEKKLGSRTEFARVARYLQVFARRKEGAA